MFLPGQHRQFARLRVVLLAPSMGLLLLVVFLPLGLAVRDSLHRMDLSSPQTTEEPVGDGHFRELVSSGDFAGPFWRSLRFASVVTVLEVLLGIPLAFWLHGLQGKVRRLAELGLLVPLLTAPVTVGLAWLLLLQPDYGIVPWLLDLKLSLLASPAAARWTVRFVDVWQWTPFVTLLCLGALESVPSVLREASRVDRLSRWQQLRAVDLPYLLPVLGVAALLRFLEAFKVYDTVTVLTNGGPGKATDLISLALTRLAFQQGRFGYAAAATLMLDYLVIVAATVLFVLLRLRRRRR